MQLGWPQLAQNHHTVACSLPPTGEVRRKVEKKKWGERGKKKKVMRRQSLTTFHKQTCPASLQAIATQPKTAEHDIIRYGISLWSTVLAVSLPAPCAPWCCASTAQQQPKQWCVISSLSVRNPKHSALWAAVEKSNSIPGRPGTAAFCSSSSIWFVVVVYGLDTDFEICKCRPMYIKMALWAETSACLAQQYLLAVSNRHFGKWRGIRGGPAYLYRLLHYPTSSGLEQTGGFVRTVAFNSCDSPVADEYIASLFESTYSVLAVEMTDRCKCNCVTSVEFR